MEEQETQLMTNTILAAIGSLRQEMNQRFDKIEERLTNVEERLTNVENDVRQVKELQFVFENELDRIQAMSHKSLDLAYENRADVRILRREVESWSKDVRDLQNKAA